MSCTALEAVLPDVLAGIPLEPQSAEHLRTCASCQRQLEQLREVWRGLERDDTPLAPLTPFAPLAPPPPLVRADLAGIRAARKRLPLMLAAVLIGAVACVLAMGPGGALPAVLGSGLSVLFFVLAALCLGMGFHLSAVPRRMGLLLLGGVPVVFALYGLLGAWLGTGGSPPPFSPQGIRAGLHCTVFGFGLAVPVLLASILALRAARLPTLLSGMLLGAGSGMISAGIGVSCPMTDPSHTLLYHGVPLLMNVVLPGLIGAGVAHWLMRRFRLTRIAA